MRTHVYVLATVVLLGLVVAKLVDLAHGFYAFSRTARLLLAFLAGIGIAWATDYSIFASWGIGFRSGWMSPVGTGLTIGGLSTVWHELLDMLSSYARRVHDQATEIETRIPRAA